MRWIPLYALAVLALLLLAHRLIASRPIDDSIRLDSQHIAPSAAIANTQPHLRVGMAPIVTPVRTFREYQALTDKLAEALQVQAQTIQRDSYAAINSMLRHGEVDLAFVCSGGYASEPDAMDVLAAPVIDGKAEYHALVIVPAKSPVQKFEDLRGKDFLYVERQSNTGYWYPCRRSGECGQAKAADFFGSVKFTGGHDLSILAIAGGLAQGASISSTVYDYMLSRDPSLKDRVRVIERSPPYPSPPVVVRKSMPLSDRQRLLQVLVSLHETEKGRELLRGIRVDKYVPARNEDYARVEPCKQ